MPPAVNTEPPAQSPAPFPKALVMHPPKRKAVSFSTPLRTTATNVRQRTSSTPDRFAELKQHLTTTPTTANNSSSTNLHHLPLQPTTTNSYNNNSTHPTQTILDNVPAEQHAEFAGYFQAAQRSIANGVVAANHKERQKYWTDWKRFATICGVDPYLQDVSGAQKVQCLTAYAERVRAGYVGRGAQVRAQTIQVALCAIGTTCELAGLPNPTYRSERRYLKPIEWQLEAFQREDPPPSHKLAVPVSVVEHLALVSSELQDPKTRAVANLACIAFYYLLRVGEYTYHNERQQRRTKQFRVKDVCFWDQNDQIIPNDAPLSLLFMAKSATLSISNQKNGTRGSLINHEANGSHSCPIHALARTVHHILRHNHGKPNDILGTYFDAAGYKMKVTASHIGQAIKKAVVALDLSAKGFPPDAVGTHSLRAGGAMAMHLNGVSPLTIRKMGRWSSDTFLMYIHEQVAAFSAGVSKLMAHSVGFRNIAGPAILINTEDMQVASSAA